MPSSAWCIQGVVHIWGRVVCTVDARTPTPVAPSPKSVRGPTWGRGRFFYGVFGGGGALRAPPPPNTPLQVSPLPWRPPGEGKGEGSVTASPNANCPKKELHPCIQDAPLAGLPPSPLPGGLEFGLFRSSSLTAGSIAPQWLCGAPGAQTPPPRTPPSARHSCARLGAGPLLLGVSGSAGAPAEPETPCNVLPRVWPFGGYGKALRCREHGKAPHLGGAVRRPYYT